MNLKKLYTKYGEHSIPLSLFRKFDFFQTLYVIFVLSDYRKCMGQLRFSKKQQRTAMHSRLALQCVVSLSSLVTFFKGKVKNIFNQQELVDFRFETFDFPTILS